MSSTRAWLLVGLFALAMFLIAFVLGGLTGVTVLASILLICLVAGVIGLAIYRWASSK